MALVLLLGGFRQRFIPMGQLLQVAAQGSLTGHDGLIAQSPDLIAIHLRARGTCQCVGLTCTSLSRRTLFLGLELVAAAPSQTGFGYCGAAA